MTEKRHSKPSDAKCYLMSVFLDQIYRDRYIFDDMFPFKIVKDGKRFRKPFWSNTSEGLTEQYNELYGEMEGFEKVSSNMMWRYINDLEKHGILIPGRNHRAAVEFKHYPNETTEGYLNLLRYIKEDFERGNFPDHRFGLDPIYGPYSEMVLNRQFVLDILRKNVDCIRTVYNEGLVDIPLVGRYIKNYETSKRLDDLIEAVEKIGRIIRDGKNRNYGKVLDLVHDEDSPRNGDGYKLNREKRKSNLKMIDERLKPGLLEEKEFMEMYGKILKGNEESKLWESFCDDRMEKYKQHLDKITPDYPRFFMNKITTSGLAMYRQEAEWLDIVLTSDEKEKLESIAEGLSDFYVKWIDENIVMPILCLIQMSPRALYAFIETDGWLIPDRIYTYSSEMALMKPLKVKALGLDPVSENYFSHLKMINTLLYSLTVEALQDYLKGSIRAGIGVDSHTKVNRTNLMTFGYCCMKMDEGEPLRIPALFTFSVYREYSVSIYVSDNPGHNMMKDSLESSPDEPYPLLYDWGPAVGISYKRTESPYVRGRELLDLILNSVSIDDVYLRGIITEALISGRI